jgi:hypothetical protein
MKSFMKRLVLGVAISALAVVAFTQAALADPRDFMLENDSYSTVLNVYVSPANSTWWGYDVLGDTMLFSGYQVPIRFNSYYSSTCYYDIKVVTTAWRPTYFWDVNLCTTSSITVR